MGIYMHQSACTCRCACHSTVVLKQVKPVLFNHFSNVCQRFDKELLKF